MCDLAEGLREHRAISPAFPYLLKFLERLRCHSSDLILLEMLQD